MSALLPSRPLLLASLVLFIGSFAEAAEDKGWINLTNLESWRKPVGDWLLADSAGLDPDNPRLLTAKRLRACSLSTEYTMCIPTRRATSTTRYTCPVIASMLASIRLIGELGTMSP